MGHRDISTTDQYIAKDEELIESAMSANPIYLDHTNPDELIKAVKMAIERFSQLKSKQLTHTLHIKHGYLKFEVFIQKSL